MKRLLLIGGIIVGLFLVVVISSPTARAATVCAVFQGCTGQNTLTSGQLLYGLGTNPIGTVATGTISASAPISVTAGRSAVGGAAAFTITQSNATTDGYLSTIDWNTFNNKISSTSLSGTSPITYTPATGVIACPTCSTSAATFPFTPTNNFGANTNATGTTLLLTNGLQASTTVRFGNSGVDSQFVYTGSTGFFSLGSSTPWAQFSINPTGTNLAAPTFAIGSTTGPVLVVDGGGNVSIGRASPASAADRLTLLGGAFAIRESDDGQYSLRFVAGASTGALNFYNNGVINTTITSNTSAPTFFTAGNVGVGTATPQWVLQSNSTTAPQLTLTAGINGWAFRTLNNGTLALSTTSPTIFATSTPSAITITSGGQLSTAEFVVAPTSTSIVIDWAKSNQQLVQIGAGAVTIGFTNASTSGMTKRIIVCNPNGTAGALTWSVGPSLLWPSATVPTQTTTANKCDAYSFITTGASSTNGSTVTIFGSAATNF